MTNLQNITFLSKLKLSAKLFYYYPSSNIMAFKYHNFESIEPDYKRQADQLVIDETRDFKQTSESFHRKNVCDYFGIRIPSVPQNAKHRIHGKYSIEEKRYSKPM